jgi:predicted dehydrogenase
MPAPVRVGFVGTGGIASHHLRQLQEVDGVEIVALCDVLADRAQARTQEFGGAAYTDHRLMLARESLTALYVCIPPFAHGDLEVLAARKGIHLFVEKPVSLDLAEGLRARDAIRAAGILSSVGYSLRYLQATDTARAYLAGRPVAMVTANRWGGLPGAPWWRVMSQSGGQLVEMTTHQVDLMRHLVGEILEVHARYALRVLVDAEGVSVPDVQLATFLFDSGAIGSITTTCALTQGGGRSDMEFILRDAVAHYTSRDFRVTPESAPQPDPPAPPPANIDAAFIQAIRTGDPSWIRSDYEDGLRTLDVTLAANESAQTGAAVRTFFSSAG